MKNKSVVKIQSRLVVPLIPIDWLEVENEMKLMKLVQAKQLWKLVRLFHEIYLLLDEQLAGGRIRDRLLLFEYSFQKLRILENHRSCTIYRRICSCRRQYSGLHQDLQSGCRRRLHVSFWNPS